MKAMLPRKAGGVVLLATRAAVSGRWTAGLTSGVVLVPSRGLRSLARLGDATVRRGTRGTQAGREDAQATDDNHGVCRGAGSADTGGECPQQRRRTTGRHARTEQGTRQQALGRERDLSHGRCRGPKHLATQAALLDHGGGWRRARAAQRRGQGTHGGEEGRCRPGTTDSSQGSQHETGTRRDSRSGRTGPGECPREVSGLDGSTARGATGPAHTGGQQPSQP